MRLQQQFLFVTCSLQDMIRVHLLRRRPLDTFHEKWAVQLNDTHPAVAVAEVMRLLVDDHGMGWDRAWHVTRHAIWYTNHTLLPEALERWPLLALRATAPAPPGNHPELNHRFLGEAAEPRGLQRRAD